MLVDCFFTISGFLAAHQFLKSSRINEIQNNTLLQNMKLYGKMLLQRYIRLTPVYLVVLFIVEISMVVLKDTSLFMMGERDDLMCQQYWWRNLLYIQNLFDFEVMCGTWFWSLACEMQFYVLTTIGLMIYAKNKTMGEKLLKFSCISIFFYGLLVHFESDFKLTSDVLFQLRSIVYSKPLMRMVPYLIGTITAIYLNRNDNQVLLSKGTINLIWAGCFVLNIFMSIMVSFRNVSSIVASFLAMFSHVAIAIIVSWIISADILKFHNSFTRFLSKEIFKTISKITYTSYLVSPMIVMIVFGLTTKGMETTMPALAIFFYGITILTFKISYYLTLFFEVPFVNLSKLILQNKMSTVKLD
ncbi:unnamed protein product [Diamesa serratosioi]